MTARPWTLFAAFILAMPAFAQTPPPASLAGDWNARLAVQGAQLRLALHVKKADSGFSATLDSLDQAAMALSIDSMRLDGARLEFAMNQLSARYEGTWNPATAQFEGTWSQGPASFPLNWKSAPAPAAAVPLSDDDRKFLLDYLQKTRDGVVQSVSRLTPAQWTFKPGPGRWSIAECVEHLIAEENTLYPAITKTVALMPLPDGQARSGRAKDQQIIAAMTDRSQKVTAAESVAPHGTLATPADGLAQFTRARNATIDWVRATTLDLRGHGAPNPVFQFLDAFQYWIFLAAHTARHTLQMEEVKTAPGYPQ